MSRSLPIAVLLLLSLALAGAGWWAFGVGDGSAEAGLEGGVLGAERENDVREPGRDLVGVASGEDAAPVPEGAATFALDRAPRPADREVAFRPIPRPEVPITGLPTEHQVRVRSMDLQGRIMERPEGSLLLRPTGSAASGAFELPLHYGLVDVPEAWRGGPPLELVRGSGRRGPLFAPWPLEPEGEWCLGVGEPVPVRALDRRSGRELEAEWTGVSEVTDGLEWRRAHGPCWGPSAGDLAGWIVRAPGPDHGDGSFPPLAVTHVRVAAPGYVPVLLALDGLPSRGEQVVSLEPAATLRVTCRLRRPAAGLSLVVHPLAANRPRQVLRIATSEDPLPVEGLLPGVHEVQVRLVDEVLASEIVDVPLAGAEVAFDLRSMQTPELTEVELHLRFPPEQAREIEAILARDGGVLRATEAEAYLHGGAPRVSLDLAGADRRGDGWLAFPIPMPLAPGPHVVELDGVGLAHELEVPAGGSRALTVDVPRLVRVRVWIEDGAEVRRRATRDDRLDVRVDAGGERPAELERHFDDAGSLEVLTVPGEVSVVSSGGFAHGTCSARGGDADLVVVRPEVLSLAIPFELPEGRSEPPSRGGRTIRLLRGERVVSFRGMRQLHISSLERPHLLRFELLPEDGDHELRLEHPEDDTYACRFRIEGGALVGDPPVLRPVE